MSADDCGLVSPEIAGPSGADRPGESLDRKKELHRITTEIAAAHPTLRVHTVLAEGVVFEEILRWRDASAAV